MEGMAILGPVWSTISTLGPLRHALLAWFYAVTPLLPLPAFLHPVNTCQRQYLRVAAATSHAWWRLVLVLSSGCRQMLTVRPRLIFSPLELSPSTSVHIGCHCDPPGLAEPALTVMPGS